MEKLPAIQSSHLVTRADVPLGMQMYYLNVYMYIVLLQVYLKLKFSFC